MTPPRETYLDPETVVCLDCQRRTSGTFTRVSRLPFQALRHVEALHSALVCDPCFLRRRLEGKL